jgi:hypothetical protein
VSLFDKFSGLGESMSGFGQRASGFIKSQGTGTLVVIGLLLAGGGYAAGRFSAPEKLLVTEKEVEKIVEKVVYQDKIVEKIVYVQAKKEKTREETTVVKSPDGTETTKTTRETSTDTDTKVDTDKTQETIVYRDRIVEKEVEKIKLVESKKPNWRVGAGAGVAIPYFLGQGSPGVPGLSGVVIDVGLDRRIVGPFFLRLHANTQGVLGLGLSGIF